MKVMKSALTDTTTAYLTGYHKRDDEIAELKAELKEMTEKFERNSIAAGIHSLEAAEYKAALNKIGMLAMSELAYTKEFTGRVQAIVRWALKLEDKFP
jgi:hypothetical protein